MRKTNGHNVKKTRSLKSTLKGSSSPQKAGELFLRNSVKSPRICVAIGADGMAGLATIQLTNAIVERITIELW